MIRQCELRNPILFVEFNGQNWDEVDKIVRKKHKYDSESASLIYENSKGEPFRINEGNFVVGVQYDKKTHDVMILNKDELEQMFNVLPLPIEQKIIDDFEATEEM